MVSTASKLLASTTIFLVLAPQALAAGGVDFSNNLFSDLAPLLALFGEQVAKQFLSQSLSWLEDVIFAMAPLGIVTAIVSAIRVGGPGWLKAVVGRARESRAVAEVELMSSTSHEVCELWNGEAIVRVMGSPKIAEILYFPDGVDGQNGSRFITFEGAVEKGILRNVKESKSFLTRGEGTIWTRVGRFSRTRSSIKSPLLSPGRGGTDTEAVIAEREHERRRHRRAIPILTALPRHTDPTCAPNISLNICGVRRHGELWLFAILGIVLQFGCLIFIGVTRYHSKIKLKEDENSEYAYPLMASGTLLLIAGMMACSHVVQASSEEDIWVSERSFRILWLQKGDRVNDQLFKSYALFGDKERNSLIASRRRPYTSRQTSSRAKHVLDMTLSLGTLAIAGSLVGIAGFVIQFVGIRALHWSASIAQLVVTLAMTVVRTWIRRKMSDQPQDMTLPTDDEIDFLAVKFGTSLDTLWKFKHNGLEGARDPSWEVITTHKYLGHEDANKEHRQGIKDAQNILRLRMDLRYPTSWKGNSYPIAKKLGNCLESLLDQLLPSGDPVTSSQAPRDFHWALPVKVKGIRQCITMTATSEGARFMAVDLSQLCAVISLWCYSVKSSDTGTDPQVVLRMLGPATDQFICNCGRWMDRGGGFTVMENRKLRGEPNRLMTIVRARGLSEIIALRRGSTAHTTDPQMKFISPHCIIGAEPIDIGECHETLAFVSTAPLRQMCAQEILSSFLWAIVGIVRPIRGNTRSRGVIPSRGRGGKVDEQPDSKLENSFLQRLAEIVTDSGVTSNIQDAYALIVPPFATHHKLPRRPSNEPTQDEIEPTRPIPAHE
ncbi:hypothetical protein HOY82DRAFT_115539 [Tuber indicum]|nr:hypothetical protein HOY82DRAFT_115539 [Tuber indicum]